MSSFFGIVALLVGFLIADTIVDGVVKVKTAKYEAEKTEDEEC